ncbi:PEP-CTERM sorting domain-containing protein [Okeania sp. SIO2C2]|uniref:PEP-CTERM sorting domain-containing protein n=1 Tax=Okeania sp. SIO2C2 TaxID=2607787 RepID=UPI002580F86B|nr:PEP-CTERM sorting domain-containing protein [Okeania sp. SIO2C2]
MNNLHKSLIASSVVAVGLSISEASHAITLIKNQDFAGPRQNVPSLFYDLGDGLELTVTAGTHSGGASADAPLNVINSALIAQRNGNRPGIGVLSGQPGDSRQLDASGPNEFLRFTFNKKVTLLSTIFEAASNAGAGVDEFDLGIDGIDLDINDTFATDTLRNFPGAGFPGGSDRKVDFSGGVDFDGDGTNALFPAKGLVFDFYTDDRNDDFRIKEIEVSVDVPESTSILSLLALGTLGAVSTLKRKFNPSKFIK